MATRRKTLIQLTATKKGIEDIHAASCAIKYVIYKATLVEIGIIFRKEDIAKRTLLDIRTALNDIINGFQDLRSDTSFNKKRDIIKVIPNLIEADSKLRFAIAEWRSEGKSQDHFKALGWCKECIFQINLQLE